MAAEVKITMLGTSGAGKTCYMLGLYSIMQLGLEGFTLSTTDLDDDLLLTSLWENLVDNEEKDRWPPGTGIEPRRYEFDFSYGIKRLIGFDWLDYRGGAMLDTSAKADVQALVNRLQESSCVFLCVSGEFLKEELNKTQLRSAARKAGVHRMNLFLTDVAKNMEEHQRPFPIVIVITKYDLCYKRGKDKLIEDIKKMFQTLFMPNEDWLIMISPVTLGKELENDSKTGQIDPQYLHLPLVFALYAKFREYAMTEQGQVENTKIRLDTLRNGNWFQRLFTGEEERNVASSLEASQSQLQDIQTRMALLAQNLANTQIFLGGKEIEVDV